MVGIKKYTILVVDDVPDNIDILSGILKDDYNVMAAPNGDIATTRFLGRRMTGAFVNVSGPLQHSVELAAIVT